MNSNNLKSIASEHLWMNSKSWLQSKKEDGPRIIIDAKGIYVTDSEGNTFIDCNAGYSSVNLGYGRPEIAQVVKDQLNAISYFPQASTTEPLIKLVEKLASITPGDLNRIYPVTGGSEANETAIKIARGYHVRRGERGRYKIISREGSYHGATGGVMWLGSPNKVAEFGVPYPGMVYTSQPNPLSKKNKNKSSYDYAVDCANEVERMILYHSSKTIAAVIAEPIVSQMPDEVVSPPDIIYWEMLRDICDRYGVLLIVDEVVCGFGRTGKWFGIDHFGIKPDIMTVAKGVVSCYVPLGAVIVSEDIADAYVGGDNLFRQALTFGGHPAAAAAALKNIEIIEKENLVNNAAEVGLYFLNKLNDLKLKHNIIGDIGGIGLMLGLSLINSDSVNESLNDDFSDRLKTKLIREGLLLRTDGKTIHFGPPICINKNQIDEIISKLDKVLFEL
ncbi:MAG: aspartate aminotransferase family protein [Chloroflexi bacterium]|nr:aspartate aminotransferase family protein [Chloroflexota bacterium]